MRSAESILEQIRQRRIHGRVTATVRDAYPGLKARQAADHLAGELEFRTLGDDWIKLTADGAQSVLRHLLQRDLARGNPIMPAEPALQLAASFVTLFSPTAEFLTNGTWHETPQDVDADTRAGPSWNPITRSTFDAGIVAVDTRSIGIVWVQEDA